MTILVLEDDPTLRAVLQEALEDEGFEVCAVGSSLAAIKEAKQRRFDLVITDVRMESMDGIEALNKVQKLQPQVRSIVITGYADSDAPPRAIRAAAHDYVHKPFTLTQFLTVVRRVMGGEKERTYYSTLFRQVRTGLRRLAQLAGDSEASRDLLERARDRSFQSYFVGIRSGLVTLSEAQGLWERLEQLEAQRATLSDGDLQVLADGYQAVTDLLAALGESGTRPDSPGPGNQQFSRFFRRVRAGDISTEQLKLAPLLRQTGPDPTEPDQVSQLRERIWGEGPPEVPLPEWLRRAVED